MSLNLYKKSSDSTKFYVITLMYINHFLLDKAAKGPINQKIWLFLKFHYLRYNSRP